MMLIANGVKIRNNSSLIGIFYDKWTTWYFINKNKNLTNLHQLAPELNTKHKIIENPVLEIIPKQ
jgi:hypothetical protein